MKTKIISTTVTIFILFGLAVLNTSCSLLGFGIGYTIDAKNIKNHKTEDIKRTEIDQIKIGRNVIIVDTIGNTASGKYEGTSQIPLEKYLENYIRFKTLHSDDLSIPMIGDTVDVYETEFNTTEKGRFAGFETNTIIFNHPNKKETFYIPITSANTFVYYNGKPFLAKNYTDLPLLTTLLIRDTANNLLNFPVNEIENIEVIKKNNARFKGLTIGIGIDAAIILIGIIIAMDWEGIHYDL